MPPKVITGEAGEVIRLRGLDFVRVATGSRMGIAKRPVTGEDIPADDLPLPPPPEGAIVQVGPDGLVRSFRITDLQKNATIRYEQRPRSLREQAASGIIPFTPSETYRKYFPIAYTAHFDWRKSDHDLFKSNIWFALSEAMRQSGSMSDYLRKVTGMNMPPPEWVYIIKNMRDIQEDWRFQVQVENYCQFIFHNLCEIIRLMDKWRVDDYYESPNRLLALARAHDKAAIYSAGDAILEVASLGFGAATKSIKQKVTIRINKEIAHRSQGLHEFNRVVASTSGRISRATGADGIATNFGEMIQDKVADMIPFENVVEFSKEQACKMIIGYQHKNKTNPDLSVQDPIKNPIVEKIISVYGPVAVTYKVATGIANSILHYYEARLYEEEAAAARLALDLEGQRGLLLQRGYPHEVNIRREAILQDLKNLNTDKLSFYYKLKDLANIFSDGQVHYILKL